MSQISGIGFSNFRVFKNPTNFKIAPITIFTGTNSSGKSSVFKGLKLLHNNAENLFSLNFSGEGHKLGTFQLAKSRNSTSDSMRFVLELDQTFLLIMDYGHSKAGNLENGYWKNIMLTRGTDYKDAYQDDELILRISPSKYEYPESFPFVEVYLNKPLLLQNLRDEAEKFDPTLKKGTVAKALNMRYGKLKEWGPKVISTSVIKQQIPSLDEEHVNKIANELEIKILNLLSFRQIQSVDADLYKEENKTIFQIMESIKPSANLSGFSCKDLLVNTEIAPGLLYQLGELSVQDVLDETFIEFIQQETENKIDSVINSIKYSTKEIHLLEAVRANSQRMYANQSQGTSFNDLLLNLEEDWYRTNHRNGAISFTNKWLKIFGIGDKININRIKGIATEVTIEREGEVVDLIDLGYGVTQLLPIMLYICSKMNMKPGHITYIYNEDEEDCDFEFDDNSVISSSNGPLILIEEPEANLHPKLQSLLADYFVDVAKTFEITLLVETHSEYLIRRMQVLTAAKELEPKNTIIYYLNGDIEKNGKELVTTININPDGSLTNDFGSGFIDEATNWKMELMRLKNAQLQNLN